MKYRELHNLLNDYNFGMSAVQICDICNKFGDYKDEELEKEKNDIENGTKEPKEEVKVTLGAKRTNKKAKTEGLVPKEPITEENSPLKQDIDVFEGNIEV